MIGDGYRFKPYYKWITFNISSFIQYSLVLLCFKPYYKWITFNIVIKHEDGTTTKRVLNLIINGLPSI